MPRKWEGHGLYKKFPREYNTWKEMKQRCLNPRCENWHNYGGRGIKVCSRWLESFRLFMEDMGPKPTPLHTIDRFPNNDGDYEPGNCRWATRKEQANNTRLNRKVEFNGTTLNLFQWSELSGVNHTTLAERLDAGLPIEKALTCGPWKAGHTDRKVYTKNGVTKTIVEWLAETGIGWPLFATRMNQLGWDFERALFTPKKKQGPWRKLTATAPSTLELDRKD